ncbi:MAG: hypothetical protein RSG96_06420 [Clostridia bacterium]
MKRIQKAASLLTAFVLSMSIAGFAFAENVQPEMTPEAVNSQPQAPQTEAQQPQAPAETAHLESTPAKVVEATATPEAAVTPEVTATVNTTVTPETTAEATAEPEATLPPEATATVDATPETTASPEPTATVAPTETPAPTEAPLPLECSVSIEITSANGSFELGDRVELRALLSGFDGMSYTLRWEYCDTERDEWKTASGSNSGETYAFTLDEENASWAWRVRVDI